MAGASPAMTVEGVGAVEGARSPGRALRDAFLEVFRGRRRLVEDAIGEHAGVLADRGLDPVGDLGVVAQELLGVLAALAEALAVVGEPGAGFLDDAGLHAEIDELADLRDALA